MTRQALFAAAMVLAMVGAPLTGAVAAADSAGNSAPLSVGVTQDDEVEVSVTRNDTGVANASVLVDPVDNDTYAGAGEYATDDDGEVELPAPAESVSVDVTAEADNETATTTAELVAVEENETADDRADSFGKRVSAYVLALHNDQNVTRIGPYIAAFVTAENPGDAPDHAGPPAFVLDDDADTNETEDNETDDRGPPDHAGPPADRGDGADTNETEDTETDDRGPPDHAGPPADRGDDADEEHEDEEEEEHEDEEEEEHEDDEEEHEEETDTERAEAEEADEGGEDGPPDGAGPPDRADG